MKKKVSSILESIALVCLFSVLIMLLFGTIAFFVNIAFQHNITTFQVVSFVWCFIGAVALTIYLK